jgi:hypothetical protein
MGRVTRRSYGQTFAWAVAAETGTALSRLFLALSTAGLALSTGRSVQVAIEEQRARERSEVVIEYMQMHDPGEQTYPRRRRAAKSWFMLYIQFRNMGLGPALRARLRVEYTGDLPLASDQVLKVEAPFPVIGPQGGTRGVYSVTPTWWSRAPTDEAAKVTRNQFKVSGDFQDRHMDTRMSMLDLTGDD